MSDVLEPTSDVKASSSPTVAALPPPPPGGRITERRHRGLLLLFGVAGILGIVAAVVFAAGWARSIDERDDALTERDAALAASDAAQAEADETGASFATASASLDSAEAEIAELHDELDASQESATALADANDELNTRIDELTIDNSALVARADELQSALNAAVAVEAVPAVFIAADHPEFTRYVGEVLSSRFGSSPLGADQSRCFGGAVITAIGIDGFGAGLHNAASNDTNDALVGAMQDAAAECGIDQTLIFG